MAEVVLFHHALGLTPGVTAFAGDLRAAGHTVHTPALSGGATFDSVEAGVGHAREVGVDEIVDRGAVLLYLCIPAAESGSWPDDVPVQVQGMDADRTLPTYDPGAAALPTGR